MLKYDKKTAEYILISVEVLEFEPLIWHHFDPQWRKHKTLKEIQSHTLTHAKENESSITIPLPKRSFKVFV